MAKRKKSINDIKAQRARIMRLAGALDARYADDAEARMRNERRINSAKVAASTYMDNIFGSKSHRKDYVDNGSASYDRKYAQYTYRGTSEG